MDTSGFLDAFVPAVAALFIAAFTMYIVRALRGPSIPDIVLAIDCLSYDLAVFIALISIYYGTALLIIGSFLLALWAYVFDLFVSKYLLRKELG